MFGREQGGQRYPETRCFAAPAERRLGAEELDALRRDSLQPLEA